MSRYHRQHSILLILQMICATSSALSTEATFERFKVQGRRQGHAQVIFQDTDHFIWLGRYNGLYKYDGYALTLYQHHPEDSTSLSNSDITAIGEDQEGFLWVGTRDGLNRFNPANGKCRRYVHDPNDLKSLSHNHVTVLHFDRSGTMWVGTEGGGLNEAYIDIDGEAQSERLCFKRYRYNPENPYSLSDDQVYCIQEDPESHGNIIWIGTDNGLNAFDRRSHRFTRYFHDPNDRQSISHNHIWSIHADRDGELWIGTGGCGLWKLNRDGSSQSRFSQFDLGKIIQVSTLASDSSGNLWIGTFWDCLFRFNKKTGQCGHYKDDPNAVNSFGSPLIHYIIVDRTGTVWISCQSGIHKYDPQKEKLRQYSVGSPIRYTPDYRLISALYRDREANLWIGTWGHGLVKFDLYTEQFQEYTPDSKNPNSLRSAWITAISEDDNGFLWIGTVYGLDRFDRKSELFHHYDFNPDDPNDPSRLSSDYINSLYVDPQGALWIGTARGLDKLNPRTGRFHHYLTDANNHISLIGHYIGSIASEQSGNLLLGGKGLFRFEPTSRKLIPYYPEPNDPATWISDMIGCIHRDKAGDLWVATYGNGLYRLTPDKPPIHFTEQNGLPSNFVYGILEDEDGFLWVSTFRGLMRLDPVSNTMQRYPVADDWQSNEFLAGVFCKGGSARLYFGNLKGFITILPQLMKPNLYAPPVYITSFKIFDQPVQFDHQISKLDEIRLSYKQNMFSFGFAALNYTDSDKNQYTYKMEGFQHDWIFCGNERAALFMNLHPGKYLFRVRGSNNDGVWNEEGASIRVVITPPWWRTAWAYAIYIFTGGALIFGFTRYEIARHKRKAEERLSRERELRKLEEAEHRAQVAELQARTAQAEKEVEKQQMRTRIASDLHDEIGGNLSSIALMGQMLERKLKAGGQDKRRLRDIPRIARATAESMRDIVWFINPENDDMDKLIARMRETANMMLDQIEFEFFSPENGMDFECDLNYRRNLYLAYKEVLQNIVRHSQATRVRIEMFCEDRLVTLRIVDNGIGFDPSVSYSGTGLKNFRRRAEEMGGSVDISSAENAGTTVTLTAKIP